MRLSSQSTLDDQAGTLWTLYERAFDDLRIRAAQRHLMDRDEFDAVLTDERITKYLVVDPDRGRVAGLGTMTNVLAAIPLISPEYFRHQYPQQVADDALWYVSFVAVDPDYQGAGTMAMIIGAMSEEVAPTGGIICLDIPEYNESVYRLPGAIERIGNTFAPGLRNRRLDAQVYWAYEFPEPA